MTYNSTSTIFRGEARDFRVGCWGRVI